MYAVTPMHCILILLCFFFLLLLLLLLLFLFQDVCARTEGCELSSIATVVLEVLSYIGVSLSAVGLVLTVITLLGFT